MSDQEVCLITGVGPGTGTALVRRFAAGGCRVAMLARDADRLAALQAEVKGARAYPCDVADRRALEKVYESVRAELGVPRIVIHNAVGGAFGDFLSITADVLQRNFEINTLGLLHLAQLSVPDMLKVGSGVILCTGNTSAHRGSANFAGFAPTKAAQRILAESMARAVGPKGVHVAYITIDAVIDVPWTRQLFSDKPDEFFIRPADIADECFHVARQPRSAWSFNVEIRPDAENW